MSTVIDGSAGITTNAGGSVNPSTNVDGINYSCRAWVNFNGTTNTAGFCTIRASGNVTSVADNGTGDYTVNFTTAMPDANYSLVGACGATSASTGGGNYNLGIPGTSSIFTSSQVKIQIYSTANTQTDCFFINVAIFR